MILKTKAYFINYVITTLEGGREGGGREGGRERGRERERP